MGGGAASRHERRERSATFGLALDSGALLALERGNKRIIAILDRSLDRHLEVAIPAGVLAQVWRADLRQHRLHLLLSDVQVTVPALDRGEALFVGALCARTGKSDVVDASVVSCAKRRRLRIVTSDPRDLAELDPSIPLIVV